jgi:magnesium transporter
VIATIFLPLSFVVGFFGQNFRWMVGHISGPGTFFVLGIGTELVVLLAFVVMYKRSGWS